MPDEILPSESRRQSCRPHESHYPVSGRIPPLGEERAQATVEMAVVTPVLIVLALIAYNLMLFLSATARFDRVVPDIVIAQGVSPQTAGVDPGSVLDASGVIQAQLASAMEGYEVEIEVSSSSSENASSSMLSLVGSLRTYRCTMRMRPWPSGLSIAGVELGAPAVLEHERAVTIDPWRPGVVV